MGMRRTLVFDTSAKKSKLDNVFQMRVRRALVFDTSKPNKTADRTSDKNAALCANPLANVLRYFLPRRVLYRYPKQNCVIWVFWLLFSFHRGFHFSPLNYRQKSNRMALPLFLQVDCLSVYTHPLLFLRNLRSEPRLVIWWESYRKDYCSPSEGKSEGFSDVLTKT